MSAKTSKKRYALKISSPLIALCILSLALNNLVIAQPSIPTTNEPSILNAKQYDKIPLHITTLNGVQRFSVEIANTKESRQKGLMWRKHLNPNEGLLFVYVNSKPRRFWMKNTTIPLDIIFADEYGVILNIAKGQPQSLKHIKSNAPAQYVLEILQGRAKELGITSGDRINIQPFKIRTP